MAKELKNRLYAVPQTGLSALYPVGADASQASPLVDLLQVYL
jgi:hypothetical protein